MKKLISLSLCALIAAISMPVASAATEKSFTVLDDYIDIPDNTVMVSQFNIPKNSNNNLSLENRDTHEYTNVKFADCIICNKYFENMTDNYNPYISFRSGNGGSGNINNSISFANTGAIYKKVRVKLSDFCSYFNEDGTHTTNKITYSFAPQKNSDGLIFEGLLYVINGGAITGITPDKNGMAEFYISTDIGQRSIFETSFKWVHSTSIGADGGCSWGNMGVTFGDADLGSYVSVSDATTIQRYTAGDETFNEAQLFLSDVNQDGYINVNDSTAIQRYSAGLEY